MNFKPKTEEQIAQDGMWPAGEYEFEVAKARDEKSGAGNDMLHLELAIFNAEGESNYLHDYLLEKMAFKLRHFCEATGLLPKYDAGTLVALDCEGRTGSLKLKQGKAKNGFPAKNEVADYVKRGAVPANTPAPPLTPAGELPQKEKDDIPF